MGVGPDRRTCSVCGWQPAAIRGRCRACDAYYRRHGHERPEPLIIAHGEREVARLELVTEIREAINVVQGA